MIAGRAVNKSFLLIFMFLDVFQKLRESNKQENELLLYF